MQKSAHAQRVPARATIEAVLNIVSVIVGLIDAIYTLIMKFLNPTTT